MSASDLSGRAAHPGSPPLAAGQERPVAQLHDFLDRFRPAGAPGAAGRAAVPADHAVSWTPNCCRYSRGWTRTDARCAGIIAQARDDAEQIVAAARRRQPHCSARRDSGPLPRGPTPCSTRWRRPG